ncbi:flagellar basal body-associated protein FliL [Janthinobacterium psychrotolerans]|uniref:Flagellar protein FliL n=1 Tax=Janthinobacterium psychrotolerans TaxID=1747903 RepID=A0A1A7C728_9BURK|nr:flagellar basal body-associated protein FliL [Janthinobacterium psychrotolerans]OBV40570.1 flagellar FliL protein [Janthinobacterium psychrotolerans]
MKADPKADAALAPAGASKKKLIIIILASVLVAGGVGGGAAWYFLHGKGDAEEASPSKKKKHSAAKAGPPVFVPIDSFTVNLQPENGEQYLQIAFTLQVANAEEMETIKLNMPKVRSRLLLLLSGKKASELNTVEGKQQLAAEIINQVNQPFEDKGPEQDVTDVLFTAFIIQ